MAIHRQLPDVVELLIKRGADTRQPHRMIWGGLTMDTLPLTDKLPDVAGLLIKHGADINVQEASRVDQLYTLPLTDGW